MKTKAILAVLSTVLVLGGVFTVNAQQSPASPAPVSHSQQVEAVEPVAVEQESVQPAPEYPAGTRESVQPVEPEPQPKPIDGWVYGANNMTPEGCEKQLQMIYVAIGINHPKYTWDYLEQTPEFKAQIADYQAECPSAPAHRVIPPGDTDD